MPRFMQAFEQVGLDRVIANAPQHKLEGLYINYRERQVARIDFAAVSKEHPYALWMPQPAMLAALHEQGRTMPAYDLWFHASARDLVREDGRVSGVVVKRGTEHLPRRGAPRRRARTAAIRGCARKPASISRSTSTTSTCSGSTCPRPPGNEATFQVFADPAPQLPDAPQASRPLPVRDVRRARARSPHYRAQGLETLRADLLAGPAFIHRSRAG